MPWHRTCASRARPCTLGNCRPVQGVSLISRAVFLDSQPRGPTIAPLFRAGIAQLVERNLAKVEVASSSLVSRSNTPFTSKSFLSGRLPLKKARLLAKNSSLDESFGQPSRILGAAFMLL